MCPTFSRNRRRSQSTAGRANVIRKIVQWRENGNDPLESEELMRAEQLFSMQGLHAECPRM